MSISIAENIDCMEALSKFEDKFFNLAICDPEYGISYENGGQYFKKFQGKKWDGNPVSEEYFKELQRVSVNQIIWGANYFSFLPPYRCYINWFKTAELQNRTFSECELAYTSFDEPSRQIELRPFQRKGTRIHPTQKPVELYKEVLRMFAKPNDKILDSHSGSGSLRIACYDLGFDSWNFELDPDYFNAQEKRFKDHTSQERLFEPAPKEIIKDVELF